MALVTVPVGRYSPVNVELVLVIEEVKEGDMLAASEDCLGLFGILSKFVEVLMQKNIYNFTIICTYRTTKFWMKHKQTF